MNIPALFVVGFIFLAIQISVWQMFPRFVRELCFANPIFAFIVNLGGSALITSFTGVASFVGMANMLASVLFAFYAEYYKRKEGITGLGIGWCKLFNLIPVLPKLVVLRKGGTC